MVGMVVVDISKKVTDFKRKMKSTEDIVAVLSTMVKPESDVLESSISGQQGRNDTKKLCGFEYVIHQLYRYG